MVRTPDIETLYAPCLVTLDPKARAHLRAVPLSTMLDVLREGNTVDGRNPAWPYIDLIYQKYRTSGSIVHEHIYIYICIRI